MANKYAELNAKAILLNDGQSQLLPVSKAKLIELANDQKAKFNNVNTVEEALSYLLEQDATNLESAKSYTYTSIADLDSSVAARTGYVLTGVTEVDGKLTAYTETWLDASIVSYNGEGAVDDVESALTDIYGKLAAISGGGTGSIQQQITYAIEGLDVEAISEAGKAIVSVSETDGKIAATAGNVDAQYVDVNNAGDKFKIGGADPAATLTAQATLEHLQGEIEAVKADAAKYTIDEVTNGVPENVAHRYQLSQSINGGSATPAGKFIDIPKDSSLKEVYLGSANDKVNETDGAVTKEPTTDAQSLNFVYHLETGKYKLVTIDVSKFLTQSEFENGLIVNDGKVSVKVDTDSETFLTVGANGVKLSGVKDAINTAKGEAQTYTGTSIEALDSEIAAKTDNGFSYVMTGVTETDGKLTNASYIGLSDVTVKTTPFTGEDLATLLGDENLPSNLHEALNKIAGKVSEGAAAAVTSVTGDENNTYINVKATKSGNNVTLEVDDSALGNVAKLHYDVLASNVESVTILNANPTV